VATSPKTKIALGSKLSHDGVNYVVDAFAGTSVVLRSSAGEIVRFNIATLVTDPSFRLSDQVGNETRHPTLWDAVPEPERKKAEELAAHLNEAITGYRSGNDSDAQEDEPQQKYDPEITSLAARMMAKAAELGIGNRTLWEKKERYARYGLYGLVDQRAIRKPGDRIDARVRSALQTVIDSLEKKSNVSKENIRRQTESQLKKDHPNAVIAMPAKATFNHFVDTLGAGRGLFGAAKSRRNIANRPERPYSHFHATRPGELVLIDSTPFDAFAMDPYSFQWVQIQLTIAIDLATRSLLAWRFTPVSTKAVDAALLLFDILNPKFVQDDAADASRWAYVGVPEKILVEVVDEVSRPTLAAIPFLHPESVLVDRGRVFLSEAFAHACTHLGINLFIARPYTPTDKAHVERMFKTIRERFVESLAGYKGPDVFSRGLNIEAESFWFIDEIESKFTEWVATYWQRRHHDGLFFEDLPQKHLSPNDLFQEGIARAGFVYIVPSQSDLYELLPTEWRRIQHYGVDCFNLEYDADVLNDLRNQRSPYGGVQDGKWPFRHDPRDQSRLYFFEPTAESWHEIRWTGARGVPRPFNAKTLSYAKAMVINEGGNPNNREELTETLNRLLNQMDDQELAGRKLRRLAGVRAMNAAAAAADRAKRAAPIAPDDEMSIPVPRHQVPGVRAPGESTKRDPAPAGSRPIEPYPLVSDDEDDELDV
jgi:putative transposase